MQLAGLVIEENVLKYCIEFLSEFAHHKVQCRYRSQVKTAIHYRHDKLAAGMRLHVDADFIHLILHRFVSVIHRLSQLDNDNAGYAEKLLQASTVGQYCKKLVGVIQVSIIHFFRFIF